MYTVLLVRVRTLSFLIWWKEQNVSEFCYCHFLLSNWIECLVQRLNSHSAEQNGSISPWRTWNERKSGLGENRQGWEVVQAFWGQKVNGGRGITPVVIVPGSYLIFVDQFYSNKWWKKSLQISLQQPASLNFQGTFESIRPHSFVSPVKHMSPYLKDKITVIFCVHASFDCLICIKLLASRCSLLPSSVKRRK